MPYDWKSPIKFALTFLLQIIASYYAAAIFFVLLCSFIGFCFISFKFLSDIETSFQNLSTQIISKSKNKHFTIEDRIRLKTKFCEIVNFHAEVKQLSLVWIKCILIYQKNIFFRFLLDFAEFFRAPITLEFSSLSFTICFNLVILDIGISTVNFSQSIRSLSAIVGLPIWIFIFCFFGDLVTERFLAINDVVYCCDWHLYPIELRKRIPFIMIVSQKLIQLGGFINVQCTRLFYQKVWPVHWIWIVYIALKFFLPFHFSAHASLLLGVHDVAWIKLNFDTSSFNSMCFNFGEKLSKPI